MALAPGQNPPSDKLYFNRPTGITYKYGARKVSTNTGMRSESWKTPFEFWNRIEEVWTDLELDSFRDRRVAERIRSLLYYTQRNGQQTRETAQNLPLTKRSKSHSDAAPSQVNAQASISSLNSVFGTQKRRKFPQKSYSDLTEEIHEEYMNLTKKEVAKWILSARRNADNSIFPPQNEKSNISSPGRRPRGTNRACEVKAENSCTSLDSDSWTTVQKSSNNRDDSVLKRCKRVVVKMLNTLFSIMSIL
jgi:hypothetical protein